MEFTAGRSKCIETMGRDSTKETVVGRDSSISEDLTNLTEARQNQWGKDLPQEDWGNEEGRTSFNKEDSTMEGWGSPTIKGSRWEASRSSIEGDSDGVESCRTCCWKRCVAKKVVHRDFAIV